MPIPGPILAASLSNLVALNQIIGQDSLHCLRQMAAEVKQWQHEKGRDCFYAGYLIKKAIRAVMGQVDGIAFALRQSVLDSATEMGLVLTDEERATLSERRFDKETGAILDQPKHLYTLKSTLKAFEYFPRLCGASYRLNTSGVEWRSFERLNTVRNGITHPRSLDDLSPMNASRVLAPTFLWFSQEVSRLMFDCASCMHIPLPMTGALTVDHFAGYDEDTDPLSRIFTAEDDKLIDSDLTRILRLASAMFSRTSKENSWSIKELQSKKRCLSAADGQADARNAVRTLFSAIEARTFMALRMLNAGKELRDIAWPPEDGATIVRSRPVEERYTGALTLWSRFFGSELHPAISGELWDAFRSARELRDRITHPKGVSGVAFSEAEFDLLLATLSYFSESSEALTVDQDKWINLPSNVRQAAAAEAATIKEQEAAPIPLKPIPRVGRNDQCHCGSGKKYKKCHGSPQGHGN